MQQQPNPHQEPLAMVAYRVEAVEKDLAQVKMQMSLFETTRENDLKLQQSELKIQTIVAAITDIKTELLKLRDELRSIDTKIVTQEKSSSERDNGLRESIDKLQIRTLLWFAGWFIGLVGAVFVGYVNHIFH